MSIVRMREAEGPQSGGGMDREVASRRLGPKARIGLAAGGLVLLAALFWYFMPAGNSQTVDAGRLTISSVTRAGSTISCRCARRSSPRRPCSSTPSRAAGSSASSSRTAPW